MASIENPAGHESKHKESVTDNPAVDKYNVDVAEALANEALRRPIAEAVPIYEQLVATFPTAAKYWKQYIEAHMAVNNNDAVRLVFGRCLLTCPQVPLWLCYIRYIRKVNEKKGMEGHEEIRKAFDFTLNFIGADIASGPVWMEYISFLKMLPFLGPQDSQRMLALRKVYQGAILTPTHHVEQLWKDYENFENSVNRQLAKALISEIQPKFNSARAVYRERKKYIDEIDWNMLAVPPAGSSKEEMQWMAWKRLLAFEKENPQRIDAASANKRVEFTYEQCLMYLYHYPDVWYDYATWHAKAGSIDTAVKVYQRSLEALPESELLRYAYVELEESRGANQSAKKILETLLAEDTKNAGLAHIQYIRFLRRTEGIEAARKYFVDARNSPTCTYHVYVAYANMAFCLDKEPKFAHNVFEAGTKRFMHEPAYILEYVDFLSRLNDEINIRALFERALSSLPVESSAEVWKRFVQFEQTYGDLSRMLKVEQRRKEALSGITEGGGVSALEGSLQDIVSRYSFMDLWPCSSNDLEHLSRQEWLSRNVKKRLEKSGMANGVKQIGLTSNLANVTYPDTSKMVFYDSRQKPVPNATSAPPVSVVPPSSLLTPFSSVHGGSLNGAFGEILKATPALATFLASLPPVEGPTPNVDVVLSICLQSSIPAMQMGKSGTHKKQPDVANSSKALPNRNASSFKGGDRKRKHLSRQEDNDTLSVQSQPLPTDMFRIRQMQKARATSSQTGSATASYGSAISGDLSGNTSSSR